MQLVKGEHVGYSKYGSLVFDYANCSNSTKKENLATSIL